MDERGASLMDAEELARLSQAAAQAAFHSVPLNSGVGQGAHASSTWAPTSGGPHLSMGPVGLGVKLPKLRPRLFSGERLSEWTGWWDHFSRVIGDRMDLAPHQKLEYLFGMLEGVALECVDGVPLSDDGYKVAVDILVERFGDTDVIKAELWSQLTSFPVCKSDNIKELRKTSDALERILRLLENSGVDLKAYSCLAPSLLAKLPKHVIREVGNRKPDGVSWTFALVRNGLKAYLTEREQLQKVYDLQHSASAPANAPANPNAHGNGHGKKVGGRPSLHKSSGGSDAGSGSGSGRGGGSSGRGVPERKASGGGGAKVRPPRRAHCALCGVQGQHMASGCTTFVDRQSRIDRLKQLGRCMRCAREGHAADKCMGPLSNCMNCREAHHVSICPKLALWTEPGKGADSTVAASAELATPADGRAQRPRAPQLVAKVHLRGPKGHRQVMAFLDEGSNKTWIDDKLARELQLPIQSSGSVRVKRLADEEPVEFASNNVTVTLLSKDLGEVELEIGTLDKAYCGYLQVPAAPREVLDAMRQFPKDWYANDLPDVARFFDVQLLIGTDYYHDLVLPSARTVLPRGYVLTPSRVGLLFGGSPKAELVKGLHEDYANAKSAHPGTKLSAEVTMLAVTESAELLSSELPFLTAEPDLNKFFATDILGISEKALAKADDDVAVQIVEDTCRIVDGRYEVGFPWKPDVKPEELPDNYGVAIGRLRSMERSKFRDQKNLQLVNDAVLDQLERDVIEVVADPSKADGPRVSYVAHDLVIRPERESTSVRHVFDCSCKAARWSRSVNDCLLKGPSLLPPLIFLLMRVALFPICISADLRKAFHGVGVRLQDRDAFRWLWYEDLKSPQVGGKLAVYRFKRVPFGAIASPFLLAIVLANHLRSFDTALAREMESQVYVDDFFLMGEDLDHCKRIFNESRRYCEAVSMQLRKFISSCPRFNEWIPEAERAKGPVSSILGLVWDTASDGLSLPPPMVLRETDVVTKRLVLRQLASLFDPLGWAHPVAFGAKFFLQNLWAQGWSWDAGLTEDLTAEWRVLHAELALTAELRVKRFFAAPADGTTWSLLTFADAGAKGYGCVTFLRQQPQHGPARLRNLISKCRVKPKKETRIPRLELLAASAASNLAKTAEQGLELYIRIDESFLFSDSQCVLRWLSSGNVLPTFVDNRVRAMRERGGQWFYVRSAENPADALTKPSLATDWQANSLWWEGPTWGTQKIEDWPDHLRVIPQSSDGDEEMEVGFAAVAVEEETPDRPGDLFRLRLQDFSTLRRLQRVLVFTFRLLKLLVWDKLSPPMKAKLPRLAETLEVFELRGPVKTEEVGGAFTHLLRVVQAQEYPWLVSDKPYDQLPKKVKSFRDSLNIRKDASGLLRCFGRLAKSELDWKAKFPVLLPGGTHHLSKLLVLSSHERAKHQGEGFTLAVLRKSGFWLCRGRQTVRRLTTGKTSLCFLCRRWKGPAFEYPAPPDLPEFRTAGRRAFETIGVDGLATLHYRLPDGHKVKAYIYIFVCCVTRGIHLEMVPSLSAADFVDAFIRFLSRRGAPRLVICDQQRGLVGGAKVLQGMFQRAIASPETAGYCSTQGIRFQFSVPNAPWRNGFFERLVGVFKQAWQMSIGRRTLSLWEAQTTLACVEALGNSRPITYTTENDVEVSALCPEDCLTPGGTGVPDLSAPDVQPFDEEPNELSTPAQVLGVYKRRFALLDYYWETYLTFYLPYLREKQRSDSKLRNPRVTFKEEPKVGEVVILEEPHTPRGLWKLGRVTQLDRSEDQRVRSVWVKTKTRKEPLQRPVSHVYSLELGGEGRLDGGGAGGAEGPGVAAVGGALAAGLGGAVAGRRRVRFALPALLPLLGLLLLGQVGASEQSLLAGTPCRAIALPSQLQSAEESQACVSRGVAVMRDRLSQRLCYQVKSCATGQLDGSGNCRGQCPCPIWATRCSYYAGTSVRAQGDADSILSESRYAVCSFEKSDRCAERPSTSFFDRVQLLNGSEYFVRGLTVKVDELGKSATCVGSGPTTGTTAYCNANACAPQGGRRFCYYKHSEVAFLVHSKGRVPIRAWGTVKASYYGHKGADPRAVPCSECSLECVQGGVEVYLNEGMGNLEVCAGPFCRQIARPASQSKVLLESEVTSRLYQVRIRVWSLGSLVGSLEKNCDANPFCEALECVVCMERLRNLHCVPYGPELGLFAVVALAVAGVILAFRLLACLWAPCTVATVCCCTGLWECVRCCARCLRGRAAEASAESALRRDLRRRRREKQRALEMARIQIMEMDREHGYGSSAEGSQSLTSWESRESGGRGSLGTRLTVVTMVALLAGGAQGCAESQTLTASKDACVTDSNGTVCTLNQATRLTLTPQGQQTCLLIKTAGGETLGTVTAEVKGVRFRCAKDSKYFTRSFEMRTTAVKRCANAGSCDGNKCDDVNTDTKVSEIGDTANDALGYTYCLESAGCLAESCFFCTYACLYYRNYVAAKTEKVFEVFTCPSWAYEVKVEVVMEKGNSTRKRAMELVPGKVEHWDELGLSLVAQSPPVLPVLSSHFIGNGDKVVMTKAADAGQPAAGILGQLQCPNRAKAKSLQECTLAKDTCNCQGHGKTVSCQCSEQDLEALYSDEDKVLPLTTSGVTLEAVGESVTATVAGAVSLELQVQMDGLRLLAAHDKAVCKLSVLGLAGCFSCLNGAELKTRCTTDKGGALAYVHCQGFNFATACTLKGYHRTSVVHFDKPSIDEVCTVECPARSTDVRIKGRLAYFEHRSVSKVSSTVVGTDFPTEVKAPGWLQSLGSLFDGQWWKTLLVALAAICCGVVLLPCVGTLVMSSCESLSGRWARWRRRASESPSDSTDSEADSDVPASASRPAKAARGKTD